MKLAAAEGVAWTLPSPGRVGMWALITAEAAIFVIFLVAYAFYLCKSVSGPTPSVLSPPLFISVCLLSSSATMELAVRSLERNQRRAFAGWWLFTLLLGATFLTGTALEWRHLMRDEGLTLQTNLFGTTYYSLVGLHAFHVTVGLALLTVLWLNVTGPTHAQSARVNVLSLYWHFVDAVWVVVFTVVYIIGR